MTRRSATAAALSAVLVIVALAVIATADDDASQAGPRTTAQGVGGQTQAATRPQVRTVARGLDSPWEVAFLPDRRALITERTGNVRLLSRAGRLAARPVGAVPVLQEGEGGLLGLAVDPRYRINRFVYAYRTTATGNEVVRMRFEANRLSGLRVVVDGIQGGWRHNGGRVHFGPDGALYVSTGDAGQESLSQDPQSLNGKLLRVTGFRGARARVEQLTSGHRNVQGFDWQPGTGTLVATEFGPDSDDEINIIERGRNYGWPQAQGDERVAGLRPATLTYEDVIAPSGATFVSRPGSAWTGSFVFGALRGEQLRRVAFDGDRVVADQALFEGRFGRVRTVVEGPDGALYALTNNTDGRGDPRAGDDRLLRIVPPRR